MWQVGKCRHIVLLAVALVFHLIAMAQGVEANNPDKDDVSRNEALRERNRISSMPYTQKIIVHYQHDKAWPKWDYSNNREAHRDLKTMVKLLSAEREDLRTIVISGSASPIGTDAYNYRLAKRRASILRDLIRKMPGGKKLDIHIVSTGEDWGTFRDYIAENYKEPNREKVLAILDTNLSNNEKERKLQALDKGKTWRILVKKFMAPSRNSVVIRVVEKIDPILPPVLEYDSVLAPLDVAYYDVTSYQAPVADVISSAEEVVAPSESVRVSEEVWRKPIFALRTNLLVPALNVGLEVPIGNRWSVGADYYFPWVWPDKDNRDCFELLAWGLEGRYWFGNNRTEQSRLLGHSLGLYGYMGYYDFGWDFEGHQGEFANVGVDYTYAMALGKRKEIHLELSVGVGFIYSQARKYIVIEPYGPLISENITKHIRFFGPTKANISLVVPIFSKSKTLQKPLGDE